MSVSLSAGKTSTVTKYIGGASSDAFGDPQNTALNAVQAATQAGYASMFASHSAEWHSIMTADSVDDYRDPESGLLPADDNIIELAILTVTNPFHLLQSTIGVNAITAAGNNQKLDVNSISVGGLGSDSYAGWIL
jgi:trehalose/maltose hydrolase-like predicted phosphorylase